MFTPRKWALALLLCAPVAVAGTGVGQAISPLAPASANALVFQPLSVTFVSSNLGWALGRSSCAQGRCLALRKTTDSGHTWSAVGLPSTILDEADKTSGAEPHVGGGLNVRFANASDGWIFGAVPSTNQFNADMKAVVWETRNGGASWEDGLPSGVNPNGASILDLEASGGRAYVLSQQGDKVLFDSQAVPASGWSPVRGLTLGVPAGGSNLAGGITLQGASGWVVEGNDRGTTGSARKVSGHWQDWTSPCADLGGTLTVPAARSTSGLAAICVMGGYASPLPKGAPKGAKDGSAWLYSSSNGGASFSPVGQLAAQGGAFDTMLLANPVAGTYLVSNGNYSHPALLASFDNGKHWATVYNGNVTYLGFTGPAQGVAIVNGAGASPSLVMSYNGGHTWARVDF